MFFDLIYVYLAPILKKVYIYQDIYNPKSRWYIPNTNSHRGCRLRFKLIRKFLKVVKLEHGSFLDIGSQIGFFVFKMAELGFVSSGIEMNSNSTKYSRALANLSKTNDVSFFLHLLTPDSSNKLPSYDVISILNVYHHLLFFQGKSEANLIMQRLANKTKKLMFFESGQPEETGHYWTEIVKEVSGKDYDLWAKSFLLSLGFKKVVKVGQTPSHLNKTKRSLFVAIK